METNAISCSVYLKKYLESHADRDYQYYYLPLQYDFRDKEVVFVQITGENIKKLMLLFFAEKTGIIRDIVPCIMDIELYEYNTGRGKEIVDDIKAGLQDILDNNILDDNCVLRNLIANMVRPEAVKFWTREEFFKVFQTDETAHIIRSMPGIENYMQYKKKEE